MESSRLARQSRLGAILGESRDSDWGAPLESCCLVLNFEPRWTPPAPFRSSPGISLFEYSRLTLRLPLATLTPTLGTLLLRFPSGARPRPCVGGRPGSDC
ncbi:hypothetical protein H1C71_015289 [Ictidomys tridecemlineatus]|nr:hypothetical protein H1C71_015289 [Ictidomys tridecemlineatus]